MKIPDSAENPPLKRVIHPAFTVASPRAGPTRSQLSDQLWQDPRIHILIESRKSRAFGQLKDCHQDSIPLDLGELRKDRRLQNACETSQIGTLRAGQSSFTWNSEYCRAFYRPPSILRKFGLDIRPYSGPSSPKDIISHPTLVPKYNALHSPYQTRWNSDGTPCRVSGEPGVLAILAWTRKRSIQCERAAIFPAPFR